MTDAKPMDLPWLLDRWQGKLHDMCACDPGDHKCIPGLTVTVLLSTLDQARRERDEAMADGLVMVCAYCQHETPRTTLEETTDAVIAHLAVCEKHPLRAILLRCEAAEKALEEARGALEMLYDKWENGEPCHEVVDGEADGAFMGNAFNLTKEEEDRILALLPKEPKALGREVAP